MPTLNVVNFNIVCAAIGGFITVFGLFSYLLKERFYLSEALISLLTGVTLSPHALNWIRPIDYARNVPENIDTITLYFSRLVLGVQLVIAGVQLPSRYLWKEWKSLSLLLGPGMCLMWLSTGLLVWGMVPKIQFLQALAVAACITPTDPVLSNSIVKGKFADKNIPPPLQKIIIAESGANDGLGYPFLFFALYLIKYNGQDGQKGIGEAMRLWFGETWGYTIIMSVAYGAAVGWLAKDLLHFAEKRKYVDRESFLVFAITLALFIVGTCGMLGTDDVLACFIAGNTFTWDDWFRQETEDDSLQPTIDMLLNISIFMWYGAVAPWPDFRTNDYIPIYRLIFLAILILLFRRIPMVMAFHKFIPQIEHFQQALYVGFFGPIGVSAIFYLYISVEFLAGVEVNGQPREDAVRVSNIIRIVVWFMAICSIVVHGMSVPLGKFGYHFPRSISRALSEEKDEPDLHPYRFLKRFHFHLHKKPKVAAGLGRSNGVREDKQPPTPFKIGEARPIRRSVTSATARDDIDNQSHSEPERPVIFIDTPTVQSPAASVVHSINNSPRISRPASRHARSEVFDEKDETN